MPCFSKMHLVSKAYHRQDPMTSPHISGIGTPDSPAISGLQCTDNDGCLTQAFRLYGVGCSMGPTSPCLCSGLQTLPQPSSRSTFPLLFYTENKPSLDTKVAASSLRCDTKSVFQTCPIALKTVMTQLDSLLASTTVHKQGIVAISNQESEDAAGVDTQNGPHPSVPALLLPESARTTRKPPTPPSSAGQPTHWRCHCRRQTLPLPHLPARCLLLSTP
jgi:hypothetical protein